MSYSVFLSHSSQNADWAKWVCQEAELVGIDVYLFEHDPRPGTYIAEKVQQAIRGSDAVVVLLTPQSEAAPYVQQEIGFAQAAQKPVIPLVWPNVQSRSLAMLEGREYVAFNPDDAAAALPPVLEWLAKLKAKKETAQAILAIAALVFTAWGLSKR
jgi:nucleoside 2-deoxyribosyltransferase